MEKTVILNLPPELESELSTEASRLNLPLPEYILRICALDKFYKNHQKLE